jgi:hypothetical protein
MSTPRLTTDLLPVGMASMTSRVTTSVRHDALHVDCRRLAGHGDRFLEVADAQVDADVRGERRGQRMPSRLTVLKPGSVNVTL